MLEKDKDSFPSHLNYDLIELPTELFQVSKKNKKALAELGSDAKRMNSGLKKKGKSLRSFPSRTWIAGRDILQKYLSESQQTV